MKNKIIKIIFLLLISSFLGLGANFIFAQTPAPDLEVTYPAVGTGVEPPTKIQTFLPRYVRYIYHFSIIAGGLIAFLAVIYGGFRFLTSTGNPAAAQDAREQIFAGLLGLIIILGSFIILNEINPDLTRLEPPLPSYLIGKGIIVYADTVGPGGNCGGLSGAQAAYPQLMDVGEEIKYKSLKSSGEATLGRDANGNLIYPDSLFTFNSSDEMRIEYYGDRACEEDPLGSEDEFDKEECLDIPYDNVRCIKLAWLTPGVWVFNKLDNGNLPDPLDLPEGWAEGKDYAIFQTNQDTLNNARFHDRILAIALVSNKELEINYGAILHNIPGPLMKNKGWARIYLPGDSTNNDTRCDEETDSVTGVSVTRCGPFDNDYPGLGHGNMQDTSSITVFAVPKPGATAVHQLRICREDRCLKKRIGPDLFEASIWYTPQADFTNLTDTFGGAAPYTGGNIVFGYCLAEPGDEEEWDTDEIIEHDGEASGVSSIEIQEGSNYLVLLYSEPFGDCDGTDDFRRINESNDYVEAAIINHSVPSLKTIDWDDVTAVIIVIKTLSGTES